MLLPNQNYSVLGQIIQGALRQAEQAIQTGRLNSVQLPQKNMQIYRITAQEQTRTGTPATGPDSKRSDVYRERPEYPAQEQRTMAGGFDSAEGKQAAAAGGRNTAGAIGGEVQKSGQPGNGTIRTADTTADTDSGKAVSGPGRMQTSDNLQKTLKFNFNEENLLSGILMSEVLGKPRCLRRGRW